MPKGINPHPLKLRDFLKRLQDFGVRAMPDNRGKGSEIILIRPISKNELKGPQYPIKDHGSGTEISKAVITAALRRFNIEPEDFWSF